MKSASLSAILSRIGAALTAALSTAIVASPRVALACAVCSAGREDESNTAFLISTIFLSLLPLGALGTLVFVLWRRFQKLEQSDLGSARSPGAAALPITAATFSESPASPAS